MKIIKVEQSMIDNKFYRLVMDDFRGNMLYFIQIDNGFDMESDFVKSFVHRIDAKIAFDELIGKEISASRLLIRQPGYKNKKRWRHGYQIRVSFCN